MHYNIDVYEAGTVMVITALGLVLVLLGVKIGGTFARAAAKRASRDLVIPNTINIEMPAAQSIFDSALYREINNPTNASRQIEEVKAKLREAIATLYGIYLPTTPNNKT